jgi:hypothetical protein
VFEETVRSEQQRFYDRGSRVLGYLEEEEE